MTFISNHFFVFYRYFNSVYNKFQMLKETILNYWNKTVGMINKTLSDYPLLAYGASICRKMYRVGKALTEQYSMESNLRTLLRKLIGRVDSLASTLVRIIDVVYHKKDLMSYQYSYNFNTGSIGTIFDIRGVVFA